MIWSYLHDGDWKHNEVNSLLHKSSISALTMLAYNPIPSVIEHEGGYLCSKSIYADVKRSHRKVITFDKLLKKADDKPFYTLFGMKLHLTEEGVKIC